MPRGSGAAPKSRRGGRFGIRDRTGQRNPSGPGNGESGDLGPIPVTPDPSRQVLDSVPPPGAAEYNPGVCPRGPRVRFPHVDGAEEPPEQEWSKAGEGPLDPDSTLALQPAPGPAAAAAGNPPRPEAPRPRGPDPPGIGPGRAVDGGSATVATLPAPDCIPRRGCREGCGDRNPAWILVIPGLKTRAPGSRRPRVTPPATEALGRDGKRAPRRPAPSSRPRGGRRSAPAATPASRGAVAVMPAQ